MKLRGLSAWSAGCGLLFWLFLVFRAAAGDIYQLLFLFAPLVIVPLVLSLIRDWPQGDLGIQIHRAAARLQPFLAVAVVASFETGTGRLAGILACGWLALTCICGLYGIQLLSRAKHRSLVLLCVAAGLLYMPVGGAWLVLSRLGMSAMGFQEPIVLLTAIHFHYTGFAAPVLVAYAGNYFYDDPHRWPPIFAIAATATIAGTPLLAIGFMISPFLKLLAAIILTFGLSALVLLLLINLKRIHSLFSALLLALSAGSIVAGLLLALIYSWGEFHGRLLIGISEMAWTHGILNAFGFTFCGLLGWTFERK